VTGLGTLAVGPGPALVAWVVAAGAAGAPVAPLLVLAVALAPLLALLQPARATAPRHPVTLALVAIVAALVLSAHLAALADAAALIGARRWHAIVLAAALTLLVTLMPGARRWPGVAPLIGGAALLGVLLAAAVSTGLAPWAAWGDAAPDASPVRSLALLATLALGACALVPAPARRVIAAVFIALGLSLGASSWGAYATLAAPEAGLAGSPIEALLSLPRAMPG